VGHRGHSKNRGLFFSTEEEMTIMNWEQDCDVLHGTVV